ncbi:uncharacterized protein LOC132607996 [Lycium barbarum]|uniref:uncharacterized protein LOC132607996 n=1 Tax=Lycium barbarum TaxID=112863 RepID=UPI00293E6488|nr:uncharacterized protein LOC132607996 [Lycium barbarum]
MGSEIYFELDSELERAKINLFIELERNRQLQKDLSRVKAELDKLCIHRGNTGHYKDSCKAIFQSMHRHRAYVDKKHKNARPGPHKMKSVKVKGSSQKWFVDSGCSKHMTERMENFLSLKALKGGKCVLCLLSVSQIFDRGNKVDLLSHVCTITNLKSGEVVLTAKRYKNIYAVYFGSSDTGDLTCLSAVDDNAELWHRRLGHASFTLLNKLVAKDLATGASSYGSLWAYEDQTRSAKKYIFVIVDDFSRFTWTLFLRTKDETFPVFVAFVKQIQVKLGYQVVSIRSYHGTEFDNANFNEFCAENGISHNFSASKTPQQNGVVERKNRTLEDMARTMLIAYKVFNKRTQIVEKSVHVIFDEADDGDLSIPNEVLEITNGKAEMVNQVEASNEEDATDYTDDAKVPGPSISTLEAQDRVVDIVSSTPSADQRSGDHASLDVNDCSNVEAPGPSSSEIKVSNWKHKKSHPFENVITPLNSGIQTRSKARNMFAYSAFISQIDPKNIKEALKDADWISAMQEELYQF